MAFGTYRLNWHNGTYFEEVESYFDALAAYSTSVGSFVSKQMEEAATRFAIAMTEEEEKPMSYDMHQEYGKLLSANGLSDILFDSCIMGTMSFVERKLLYLCKELEKEKVVKVSDFSGNGVRKFHLYLTKVCGVRTSEAQLEWEQLFLFNQLRNLLVHSQSNRTIPKDRSALLSMLRGIEGISMSEVHDGFVLHPTDDTIVQRQIQVSRNVLQNAYIERTSH